MILISLISASWLAAVVVCYKVALEWHDGAAIAANNRRLQDELARAKEELSIVAAASDRNSLELQRMLQTSISDKEGVS